MWAFVRCGPEAPFPGSRTQGPGGQYCLLPGEEWRVQGSSSVRLIPAPPCSNRNWGNSYPMINTEASCGQCPGHQDSLPGSRGWLDVGPSRRPPPSPCWWPRRQVGPQYLSWLPEGARGLGLSPLIPPQAQRDVSTLSAPATLTASPRGAPLTAFIPSNTAHFPSEPRLRSRSVNGWKECKGFLLGFADSRTIPEDIFRIGHVHKFSSWVFRTPPRVLVAESLSVVCKGGHSFAPPPGLGRAASLLFRAVTNRVSAHIPVPTCPGTCCGALSFPGVGLPVGQGTPCKIVTA